MLIFPYILSQKVRSASFCETSVEYVTVICVTALLFLLVTIDRSIDRILGKGRISFYSRAFQSRTQRSSRKIQICNLRNGALLTFWFKPFVQKSTLHRVIYTKNVKESEEISCISLQSSRSSFRKIQIIEFLYLHFRCLTRCLGSKSFLHRAVYTKSVKESEEISYI